MEVSQYPSTLLDSGRQHLWRLSHTRAEIQDHDQGQGQGQGQDQGQDQNQHHDQDSGSGSTSASSLPRHEGGQGGHGREQVLHPSHISALSCANTQHLDVVAHVAVGQTGRP